jgi:hypothetical protein
MTFSPAIGFLDSQCKHAHLRWIARMQVMAQGGETLNGLHYRQKAGMLRGRKNFEQSPEAA